MGKVEQAGGSQARAQLPPPLNMTPEPGSMLSAADALGIESLQLSMTGIITLCLQVHLPEVGTGGVTEKFPFKSTQCSLVTILKFIIIFE